MFSPLNLPTDGCCTCLVTLKQKRAKIASNLCFIQKNNREKTMNKIFELYLPIFTQYTNMSVTGGIVPTHQVVRTHLHTVFIRGIFGVIWFITGPVVFRNSFFSSGPHEHTLLVSVCCIQPYYENLGKPLILTISPMLCLQFEWDYLSMIN